MKNTLQEMTEKMEFWRRAYRKEHQQLIQLKRTQRYEAEEEKMVQDIATSDAEENARIAQIIREG